MLKIRLFCANGMSTSLLVKKMEEAAKEKGKEVDIKAYPILDIERLIGEADVALLGPSGWLSAFQGKRDLRWKRCASRRNSNGGLWQKSLLQYTKG